MRTLIASIAVVGLLGSCTSLPTDTEPQALRSFEQSVPDTAASGPEPGREPDLLLRDFYTASSQPTQDFQEARAYLSPEAAEQWNPGESTLVVDRIDLNTQAGSTSQQRSLDVGGNVIGLIATGGAYEPENGTYEATIEMELDDGGEWRITSLPDGVVIEQTELRNQFQPHRVFFFDSTKSVLVGDRRWIYTGHQSLDAELITLMMDGPSDLLAPAVTEVVSSEATFAGVTDGVYQFTGFADLDPDERLEFGAQLVWTLAAANVPEPYAVEVDGAPLLPGYGELTTDDFADFNPQINPSTSSTLFALTNGIVHRVGSNTVEPVDGELGSIGNITSVNIAAEGEVGAVQSQDDESVLLTGTLESDLSESLRADTLSQPTFELDPSAQWVVADGESVVRVIRAEASGEYASSEVDTSSLVDIDGTISVLRLSQTGARVAMIIDGRVYAGVVSRPAPAEWRIVNVRELASQLEGTALALDWQPDGSLVVGTSSPETPIWRVEQDGSAVTSLPSGNISAPVVTVETSSSTIYLTDALAVRQMPISGSDSTFWREVTGLQGLRSAPVVAD
ncbi:hypothetical protein C5L39_05420 [Corynebacterium alimapuense]|uniref:Lipoprotein LpqB n=2 Tax=Corynebacterium alimapuense TaxID=1576874 RepID=A0A3M8K750_9CORY|nr:hypothetical protein C5L39_05420 [Corynebacterium alimapuense]